MCDHPPIVTGTMATTIGGKRMQIHPAAERIPAMSADEYARLVADIKANGQREPITLIGGAILDGRHRARACADLGIQMRTREFDGAPGDAEAYALSMNVHRRHLSTEQKRVVIEYELRRDASQSDRSIAEKAAVDHKTVAAVRHAATNGGEIPHHAERIGRDGVKQPATKAGTERAPNPTIGKKPKAERAEEIRALAATGHTIRQIAQQIGLGVDRVSVIAKDCGINIYVSRAGKGAAKFSVIRAATETVNVIASTVQGIEMMRNAVFEIPRDDAAALLRELRASIRSIRWLESQLQESSNARSIDA